MRKHKVKIIICESCGKEKIAHGRGLCDACYYRKYSAARQSEWRKKNRSVIAPKEKAYKDAHREHAARLAKIRSDEWRRQNIETLKSIYVLACEKCGYDRCFAALEFHHLDPSAKENHNDSVGRWIYNRAPKSFKEKIIETKFMVLCANCHRELHNTVTVPALTLAIRRPA